MTAILLLCEINVADSVQWLAYDADLIVRGTCDGGTVRAIEFLKGAAAELPAAPAVEGEALFFFTRTKEGTALRQGASPAVVPLNGKAGVFDANFKEYLKKDEVLGAVRAAVKAAEKDKPKSAHVDAPADSPAYKRLWSGSSVWIVVPLDKAMLERARTWRDSQDHDLRANAAKILK